MAAPSQVLFALHYSIEPQGFENLCVDLLFREGHSRIIPGGKNRDHGRDAETRYWTDLKKGHPQTAFQFSMEAKWEAKLRKDIAKITRNNKTVERIVFVSNRQITVEKQDKLRAEFKESHKLALEILDQGWFRIRLEEEHNDLALKHLGVEVPLTPGFQAARIKLHGLTDENQKEMLRHTSPEKLRATLTAQTKAEPGNSSTWKGLADVCFFLRDYDAALFAISKGLKYSEDDLDTWNLNALKASTLAEQGIESGSRLLLNKAKELFLIIIARLNRPIDYYNMANVLGALGHHDVAEVHYHRCLEMDPTYAQAWNNLGTTLVKSHQVTEALECYDKALELQPEMLEALCTKANVLVMMTDDMRQAIQLMERAFSLDPDLERRWPYANYWFAMALCRQDRLVEAYKIVEDELERKFACPYLGRLANDILAKLWRDNPNYIPTAEKFFSLRIDPQERDYRALIEMLDLLVITNREAEAWDLLDQFLQVEELSIHPIAKRIPLSISDLSTSFASMDFYRRFRKDAPLFDYARILETCKARPHDEIPEILFHLLMPAYFKLASVLQDSDSKNEGEDELAVILEIYHLISRTFSAFGGFLLAPAAPETLEEKTVLLTSAFVIGIDLPLVEFSRLIGFLFGVADRKIPEKYRDSILKISPSIHDNWLTDFSEAVDDDWRDNGLAST